MKALSDTDTEARLRRERDDLLARADYAEKLRAEFSEQIIDACRAIVSTWPHLANLSDVGAAIRAVASERDDLLALRDLYQERARAAEVKAAAAGDEGRAAERTAIVAWLRRQSSQYDPCYYALHIERGEHEGEK